VHSLVAPPIGRTHIAIAFDSLSATAPQGLISCPSSNTLYLGTVVVVADQTAAIVVFHIKVALMATHAVKRGGNDEVGEKSGKIGQDLWGRGG
jgi:hypothetical protein